MKRKVFVTLCAVVFGCMSVFGEAEKYPVSLNAKDWNNFRFFSRPNKNAIVSNLEENGKQLLRVTFSKTPGVKDLSPCAYRQFIPILNTGKYSKFRCKVRFSAPVSTASVCFYYKGWQTESWKKMQNVGLHDNIRAKNIPAQKWIDININLKHKELDRITLGLRVTGIQDGAQVIADFQDMEFYAPDTVLKK